MIGLDKTILSDIRIEAIDLQLLRAHPTNKRALQLSTTIYGYEVFDINNNTFMTIDTLTITDSVLFNTLKLNYKINKSQKIYYVFLDLFIDSKDKPHNLKPLNYSEYIQHLKNIKQYLQTTYGIYISYREAKFKQLEVNNTQQMDYPFSDYMHIIDTITPYLDNRRYKYKSVESELKTEEIGTAYFKSKSLTLKLYDKTKQLQQVLKIKVEPNLMRIEYTLNDKAIERQFNTRLVNEFSQEALNSFYNESITKDFLIPFNKAINESNKKLKALYQKIKKQQTRGAFREFLHQVNASNILIDSAQLPDIATYELKQSTNKSKNKKLLEQILNPQYNKTFSKFKELITKFQS